MDTYTRDLERDSVGDDVARLQEQLATIGFPIAPDERQRKRFGPTTEQAVSGLQRFSADALGNLEWQGRSGVVERATAEVISRTRDRVVERRKPPPPSAPEPAYRVTGAVQGSAGEPMVGATVTVSDQNVRGVWQLGRATTSETGAFEISFDFRPQYRAEARSPQAGPAPDLRFEVVDANGHDRRLRAVVMAADGRATPIERIVRSSAAPFIIVNATTRTEVVLHIDEPAGRDPLSEFEEVDARLSAALQGVPYDELTEADGRFQISFLSAETSVARPIIERLILGARAARLTASRNRDVPVALFYGLGHASLPVDLAALAHLPRTNLTSALRAAVAEAVIPARLARDIDRHVDTILAIGAEQAMAEPLGDGRESARTWLELAGLTAEGQQVLMRELSDHQGPEEDLWQRLSTHPAMGGADSVRLTQLVLRLSSFTDSNLALVRLLLNPQHAGVRSLADLARLDESAWLALIARAGVPASLHEESVSAEEAGARYGRRLMRVAQQAYQTAAVEGIAARSHAALALDPDLSEWLAAVERAAETGAAPALDLRSTHIDRYVDEHAGRIEFQPKSAERLRSDLKRVQRTLAIAQEPWQIVPLLRAGHDSALGVANVSVGAFLEIHGAALGAEAARAIHARARQLHFAHLFVHTMVFESLRDVETTR